jgi:ubiquinone/menaquinone biosynthesis C-methylase UbiE
MLDKAKLKVNDKKVTFVKTDLMKPWDIDIYFADLITCSLTLEHIENLDTIFTQANKKLKTDGLFFICELHPFKQYLGSKARFETANGIVELDTFIHHTAAYLQTAKRNNFKLLELKEWFDEDNKRKIPRLISFMFQKNEHYISK